MNDYEAYLYEMRKSTETALAAIDARTSIENNKDENTDNEEVKLYGTI